MTKMKLLLRMRNPQHRSLSSIRRRTCPAQFNQDECRHLKNRGNRLVLRRTGHLLDTAVCKSQNRSSALILLELFCPGTSHHRRIGKHSTFRPSSQQFLRVAPFCLINSHHNLTLHLHDPSLSAPMRAPRPRTQTLLRFRLPWTRPIQGLVNSDRQDVARPRRTKDPRKSFSMIAAQVEDNRRFSIRSSQSSQYTYLILNILRRLVVLESTTLGSVDARLAQFCV